MSGSRPGRLPGSSLSGEGRASGARDLAIAGQICHIGGMENPSALGGAASSIETPEASGGHPGPAPRRHDPARTRQDILAVATEEFAEQGFSGARVDAIAARTRTTKRMIYYYFGSKEDLYLAVLEEAYQSIRRIEAELHLERFSPVDAIRRLVEFAFDYHERNPQFVQLINGENVNKAATLARSGRLSGLSASVIETLGRVLDRGQREGVFRAEVDPVDLHMMISAFCFFRVSNRHTFGTLYETDFFAPGQRARHRRMITGMIIGWLERGPGGAPPDPAGA